MRGQHRAKSKRAGVSDRGQLEVRNPRREERAKRDGRADLKSCGESAEKIEGEILTGPVSGPGLNEGHRQEEPVLLFTALALAKSRAASAAFILAAAASAPSPEKTPGFSLRERRREMRL